MSTRIFRKAIGLLIVNIVIIIGIFVIQFRTDSTIIKKFGNIQLTLEKADVQQTDLKFKNSFTVSYNGLFLYCDDLHPVQIFNETSGAKQNLNFLDIEKVSETACRLIFSDDVSVLLSVSSDSTTAPFTANATLPAEISNIYIPFRYNSSMKLKKDEGSRIIMDSKTNSWETSAFNLADNLICMNNHNLKATYSLYEATVKFTLDALSNLAIAEEDSFNQTLAEITDNLIAAYNANASEENVTEQVVISYIAAMAGKNKYTAAIEDIPQNFKKSSKRTYRSTPFFNSLEKMNAQIEKEVTKIKADIAEAAYAESLEIFTTQNFASKICVSQSPKNVTRIFERAVATNAEKITLSQAAGIIEVYTELTELKPDLAQILQPALEKCIQRVTDSCNFDGSVLTVSDNDIFISVIQAAQTGIALYRYGLLTGNTTLVKAGRVFINSYLQDSSAFDLRTLASLYPIIAYNNTYYPHFQNIVTPDGHLAWAWTCANNITYEKEAGTGAITLNIDFPEGWTHYVILKGIPQFTSIYIYNMAFRTDPRFETYNSSGYVYKDDGKTLLLKSRHKSRIETVRMEYDEELVRRREAEKQAAEEKAKADAAAATSEAATVTATTTTPSD